MNTETVLTREQILKREDALIRAIQTNDVAALDEMLHDDLLFMVPDGNIITKAMDLDAHLERKMLVERIEAAVEQINLMQDTAVAVVVLDTKGTMMGQPVEGRFRYVRFWKLCGDSVKVIGGSCIRILPGR